MQVLGDRRHLVVDVAAERCAHLAHAVEQADAERDGANVELLGAHHADGFKNLLAGKVEISHPRSRPF